MADTTFAAGTVIASAWLNDLNTVGYKERTSALSNMTTTQITAILAEAGAAAAECSTALQTNMDAVAPSPALLRFPHGTYQIGTTLRVKNGTPRVSFLGDTRIRTTLQPNAVSLAGTNTLAANALIVIQDNNAHFCMENMRMTASNAYTGMGIYCQEGGGTDLSGQCLFSGIFKNLWIDFPSTNTGFLTGGTQNTVFDTMTFENMKGCFNLVGAGNVDNFYRNISMSGCYDQLIAQNTDTNGSIEASVDGVHCYNHNRGRLFDLQNWQGGNINDIVFEAATGNLGTTGLVKIKACTGFNFSNFSALTRTGVPACATGIEILGGATGTTAKFSNGFVNADIGVKINDANTITVEFNNVDFTNCTSAAFQIAAAGAGTIRTRHCKFNDSTIYGFVNQVGSSHNWYSYEDEFINAGLGGNAGSRNIALTTSGTVILVKPRIGRDNGSAAAAYFIEAAGAGTVDIYDPIWVGTPPTAYYTGAQAINIHVTQASNVRTITAATDTVLVSDHDLIANRAGTVTFTLPTPTVANLGRELYIITLTANTVVSASANVIALGGTAGATGILAATQGKWARLISDGTNWRIMAAN